MSGLSRRIVITGLGVVSPIGSGPAFLEGLAAGRSGTRRMQMFDPAGLEVRLAAEVLGFDARDYVHRKDRKSLKMMARTVQLAVAAARLAFDDSGLNQISLDPMRLGVVLGSSTVPGELADLGPSSRESYDATSGVIDMERWGRHGMDLLQPMWMLNHVPNMAACHVSILHNAQGPSNTVTQSDAAGLLAVQEAVRIIDRHGADVILTGGADTRTPLIALIRYSLFTQLSRREDHPESACRPFDLDRDGQVMGEGAGVLVVEEYEHARSRNARILGEIAGYAAGFDRGRTGKGLARVIRQALQASNTRPDDLDHVNAHAPGSLLDDAWEARALVEALNGSPVPVLACKSFLGNTGAAAGTIELATSLLALTTGQRPATLNYATPDPACPVTVASQPAPVTRPCFLTISCTEMGQCAAMVVRRVG